MDENRHIEEMFGEFLKIYKFINHPKIIEALNTELGDDIKKKIYQLTDGENTLRDIEKITGVSKSTIPQYWKQWALKGIVEPAQRKGRYKATFNLAEYGLSVLDNIDDGGNE